MYPTPNWIKFQYPRLEFLFHFSVHVGLPERLCASNVNCATFRVASRPNDQFWERDDGSINWGNFFIELFRCIAFWLHFKVIPLVFERKISCQEWKETVRHMVCFVMCSFLKYHNSSSSTCFNLFVERLRQTSDSTSTCTYNWMTATLLK